ncbi:MAG: aminotransferase class I/II-fold pyridoxal phosphate-dependent enzyme, partial [Eggerthellaceae bacterium]|nr:aminotransferase class I/II-fold pyridoxal phosphate-dependent enzyme [Eggerthellaceae bacterium]
MIKPNTYYSNLKDSYLFSRISETSRAYLREHPDKRLYHIGIGDVSLPLCDAVIKALHEAVNDQASKETFHGYMPECGDPQLREAISEHYSKRGLTVSSDEVFVSSGAGDDLADVLDLFDQSNTVLVIEPAYPAYVDTNVMDGRKIIHFSADADNSFLPEPNPDIMAEI